MHKDFKDLLSAFNAHNVQYMIVGGYAYARYTEPRTTKDLNLFLRADLSNARAVFAALVEFGASLEGVSVEDFAQPTTIFQMGVAPFRVDLIGRIDGVTFDEAWASSEDSLVDEEIPVRYISSDQLIVNKLAASRPQDLVDVEKLRLAARARKRE